MNRRMVIGEVLIVLSWLLANAHNIPFCCVQAAVGAWFFYRGMKEEAS